MSGWGQLPWLVVVASGALVALGLCLALIGLLRRPVRLGDALAVLDGAPTSRPWVPPVSSGVDRGDRLGHWVLTRLRVPVSEPTRRLLTLKNRSLSDYAAEKAALSAIGFLGPVVFGTVALGLRLGVGWTPFWVALAGAAIGWFVPDVRLRSQAAQTSSDASEAICTFVDLVTLERLANQSSSQALQRAASVSQTPLFRALQAALERARLEQRPAWQALAQVGRDLDLQQLADLADVIRLDEQGAALSGVLRARAEELRDAQLLNDKVHAQEVSESLTIWMVIPAMVFGLIFLVPPLMRLVAS
ncbi:MULTISPECIES: type II secretion system F family protein [Aestuariimicrobium]|uniref:type II secretion system F family protein n=1 Tax=Aestuariimicrobium TaxID=396388 RepID=UPI0003B687FA|nr:MULTISPECIES: type II secretion system F family protein [Aestuariimicrobium]CAI9403354.1 hypothetical protein AESSP_00987 [Aestuariimicrobium sp. T2.26MG-19.2B]